MDDLRLESPLPVEQDMLIRKVIGAAIEVHKVLGPGFLESIYEEALCHELTLQSIKWQRQKELVVNYKGKLIPGQRLDLIVENVLILELKAVDEIHPVYSAIVASYLKAAKLRAALIINFRVKQLKLGIKRVIL